MKDSAPETSNKDDKNLSKGSMFRTRNESSNMHRIRDEQENGATDKVLYGNLSGEDLDKQKK